MEDLETPRPVVLIVEDEFLIRMHAAEMISDAGFEVVEACNADQAIAILESRADIRVVFTDIQMTGSMDGLKLAHAFRHRWPPVHGIATSAYLTTLDDLPAACLCRSHIMSAGLSAPCTRSLLTKDVPESTLGVAANVRLWGADNPSLIGLTRVAGYTVENTWLVHHACYIDDQKQKAYL